MYIQESKYWYEKYEQLLKLSENKDKIIAAQNTENIRLKLLVDQYKDSLGTSGELAAEIDDPIFLLKTEDEIKLEIDLVPAENQ